MAGRAIAIEASSGNVFADLGLPDAAELDTKTRLAVKLNGLIAAQQLSREVHERFVIRGTRSWRKRERRLSPVGLGSSVCSIGKGRRTSPARCGNS
jgi:hypothetical protein